MIKACFRPFPVASVLLVIAVLALTGCDPGGRLAQLTPQPPASPPIAPGVTVGAPSASEAAPIGPEASVPTPLPTATYDAARPAWTILYYAVADNGRADYVWDDLNEMEAAPWSDQVRIVAQVDWPEGGPAGTAETVRYLIRPGEDRAQLTSEVVSAQPEVNAGDLNALADFLTWGIANYPANRYALVLGDFGGGWRGCCLDEIVGVPDQTDHLTLNDLAQAFTQAQAGGVRFDVIAFAAGLMNQLDVLQTIQPYAAYAVASPELMPGSSWDYQAVITQLGVDPLIDGRQFAGDLVTAYVNSQRQLEGNEYIAMAAVDLRLVPTITGHVEALAAALASDPGLHGAIAADARRAAQQYGAATLAESETIAAVDLLHAAAILYESAPAGSLADSALNVMAAITEAIVAYDHGAGIPNGRGIAIYWPASTATFDSDYINISRLPSWAAYLAGPSPSPPYLTNIRLDSGPRDTVHIASPAFMRADLTGHRLAEVALVAGQVAADGRHVLRQYEVIQPADMTFKGGVNAAFWRDGQHESLIIWDATAPYLADAAGTGDFVPLRPIDASPAGPQLAAAGQFQPAGSERVIDASVAFASGGPASRHLWATVETTGGARLVGEIAPAPGDVFYPSVLFIDGVGNLTAERGVALVFDESSAIYRSTRALPAGSYALGIRAGVLGTGTTIATQPVTVDPSSAPEGFRAYVDAARGVQFLYPAGWLPPVAQEAITYTRNISDTAQMQVRYYPGWTGDLTALQNEVMGTFGQVSILQNEPATIGAEALSGLRTAYGYESAEKGPRTGVFLAFLKDGVGYVVDMDGPRADETATLAYVDAIAATWQFLPERLGFGPELWSVLNVGEFRLRYPNELAYQAFNNWHRFAADSQTFAAVRIQPAGRTPAEAMIGLLETAAEGVAGFSAGTSQRVFYGGFLWERNDFIYTDANGAVVRGLLLSRQQDGVEIAFWSETPDPPGNSVERLFLPIAASIERIPPPPSG